MEPMIPSGNHTELDDIVLELVQKSSQLASQVHPIVQFSVGELVRSLNCYYSNLIEGHNTHPWDIERALLEDYSKQPEKRNLQLEAKAHIEVQKLIDENSVPKTYPSTKSYIFWLHQEFCNRLPAELLKVENPETKEIVNVVPGEYRTRTVRVGYHVPPHPENLEVFMHRFEEAYNPEGLSKSKRIIAAAASHHRLLWIHPFLDGNGRVTRLMSYAILLKESVGSYLWSISRGLARNVREYKQLLMQADENRHGDLDGRGTLSESTLMNFCKFFLATCIDQVNYMSSLLQLNSFIDRLERYSKEEIQAKQLPRGSFSILREAFLMGEVKRNKATELTGYKDRMAREVISTLLKKGLVKSNHHKDTLRLAFPLEAVEKWFPGLYPELNLSKIKLSL
ncbi:MAG: Fic family protein [Leptospiraceae bacterium]|nr:Fic family protein [Leptospiraceae bacterium]